MYRNLLAGYEFSTSSHNSSRLVKHKTISKCIGNKGNLSDKRFCHNYQCNDNDNTTYKSKREYDVNGLLITHRPIFFLFYWSYFGSQSSVITVIDVWPTFYLAVINAIIIADKLTTRTITVD